MGLADRVRPRGDGDAVRPGDQVILRRKQESFYAVVEWHDEDECIGNPEEHCRLRLEDGRVLSFRRKPGTRRWAPNAKSLRGQMWIIIQASERRHGHPCDHSAGVCEDAPPDCGRCSSECDACDGSGVYTIDGKPRPCICSDNPCEPPAVPERETK